jgi:hypothetical protein
LSNSYAAWLALLPILLRFQPAQMLVKPIGKNPHVRGHLRPALEFEISASLREQCPFDKPAKNKKPA